MRILLTGGAGYIGSHVLLRCLEAGHEVLVLDDLSNSSAEAVRRVEALAGRSVAFHQGDVRDASLLAHIFAPGHGVEAVMHFAGRKAVGESVEQPLLYHDVNVGGSIALLQAMARAGVFRFVFSSTASVYGDQAGMPLTEDSPTGPASPYGRSKHMVEQILADLCAADPRWAVGILRYFNPIGAHPSGHIGEDPLGVPANLVPFAMQVAVGLRPELTIFGNDYPTPDGTGIRDYIHVMDLADGHLAAMDYLARNAGCRIWNLGTGQGYSVLDVVRATSTAIGRDLPHRIAPRRPGDTAQCWAAPARAATDLGWKARRDLAEMLADHWRWQVRNPRGYR